MSLLQWFPGCDKQIQFPLAQSLHNEFLLHEYAQLPGVKEDVLQDMRQTIQKLKEQSTNKIHLVIGLHGQDPHANDIFHYTFDEQVAKFIAPMARVLEENPFFKISIHFSGPQLTKFEQSYPNLLARYVALYKRGQIEPIGGSDGEHATCNQGSNQNTSNGFNTEQVARDQWCAHNQNARCDHFAQRCLG